MARADEATRFKPGQSSGNPRGRSKDSRNRLSEQLLAHLADDFEQDDGLTIIQRAKAQDPLG